jgi:hypothetical protein
MVTSCGLLAGVALARDGLQSIGRSSPHLGKLQEVIHRSDIDSQKRRRGPNKGACDQVLTGVHKPGRPHGQRFETCARPAVRLYGACSANQASKTNCRKTIGGGDKTGPGIALLPVS